jgi:divalent metal cation (Fe/Co/Zn/Cd) transporter
MNKAISLAILAGGILVMIFGIGAMNSAGSDISRFFTGAPTDRAIWMLVGGLVASVTGLAGLLLGSKAA